jgi:hypothetical protein
MSLTLKTKPKCNCGKEVNAIKEIPDNFEFVGCDEKNNPVFQCVNCKVYVYG